MAYLLDTNAWIRYLKEPASGIQPKMASLNSSDILSCSIVRSELLHGAEKYGNTARRIALIEMTLAPFVSLAFDDEDAAVYGKLRHELELSGSLIGPYDLQIAAICQRRNITLVSNNVREFSRVRNLRVEDWQ